MDLCDLFLSFRGVEGGDPLVGLEEEGGEGVNEDHGEGVNEGDEGVNEDHGGEATSSAVKTDSPPEKVLKKQVKIGKKALRKMKSKARAEARRAGGH